MKFKVGDIVCCKNSSLRGAVVKLLDSRHVMLLEDETGMEIDYPIHTLILVEASYTELTATNPTSKETPTTITSKSISIDLHTEKLPQNYRTTPPLYGQLDFLDYKLALAIQQGAKQVTIIHGIGNGTLKNEVMKRLRSFPQIKSIEDPEKILSMKNSKLRVNLK